MMGRWDATKVSNTKKKRGKEEKKGGKRNVREKKQGRDGEI